MKLATEGARRWLLATLHDGLVPTDNPYDADTAARTLTALLRAPGTVRFEHDAVHVTLDSPLAPEAHAGLDAEPLDAGATRASEAYGAIRIASSTSFPARKWAHSAVRRDARCGAGRRTYFAVDRPGVVLLLSESGRRVRTAPIPRPAPRKRGRCSALRAG